MRYFSYSLLLLAFMQLSPEVSSQCSVDQEVGTNLVINGDFEDPNLPFTTEYPDQFSRYPIGNGNCFEGYSCDPPARLAAGENHCGCYRNWSVPGEYYVGSDVSNFHFEFTGTEDPTGGNVLFVDGSDDVGVKVWCQDLEVLSNTAYYFSAQIASLSGNATINATDISTLNFTVGNENIGTISTSTTVGAWEDATFIWNSGSNSGSMTLCFTTAAAAGCTSCNDFAIDNITFVADCQFGDDTPVPDLGENLNICGEGGSVTLDPGITETGVSYEWNTGETSPTIDVTSAGTYSVCIQKGNGCVRSDIIEVVDDYTVDLGSDLVLCDPPQINLNPQFDGPGVSFAWELDGNAIGGDTPTLSAGEPGTYTVVVTEPSCGQRTASVTVTSLLVETEDFEYCPGDIALTATGATTFNFYDNENDETPIGSGASYTVDLSAGGDHTFWVENGERTVHAEVGPSITGHNQEGTDQGDRRMPFRVTQEMRLETVDFITRFYGEASLTGFIQLFAADNSTQLMATDDFTVTRTGGDEQPTTATLNWDIEPGDYYLALGGNLRARFRNGGASATGFPYTQIDDDGDEVFRLLGSTGNPNDWNYDAVFFFNNWTVSQPSKCGRVPLNVVENCPCSNPDVVLSGGSSECEGVTPDDVVITITPGNAANADQWHIIYAIDGIDQPEEIVTDPFFTITNPTAGAYTLTSVFENENGGKCLANSMTGTGTVEILSPPTVTIAGDADICQGNGTDLTFTILGDGPFDLTWSDGTTNTTATGLANPATFTVSPTLTTTYSIVTVTDAIAPQCPATDPSIAEVVVTEPITGTVKDLVCNGTSTAYTVAIDVFNAAAGTFTITGGAGTLTGTEFLSDEIPAGDPYSFVIEPNSNCPDITLADVYDCPCLTNAGQNDLTTINACQGDVVAATHDNLETLDDNDLLLFVLHDNAGASLGNVIAYSPSSVFNYDPSIVAGQTYYISAIAGDDNGSGGIDLTDGCVSISPGTPVIYAAAPVAQLSGSDTICPGESVNISIALFGTPNYDFTLSDDLGNDQDFSNVGGTIPPVSITPPQTVTYSITALTDGSGSACPFSAISDVTITVLPALSVTTQGHDLTCYRACETGKGFAEVNPESLPFVDDLDYSWTDATNNAIGQGQSIGDLCAGDYTVSVTNGYCSTTAPLTINEPSELTGAVTGNDPSCFGYTNGVGTAAGNGGSVVGAYTFEWPSGTTTAVDTGLAAGTFDVIVRDDSLCEATATLVLGQPNEIVVTVDRSDRTICLGNTQTVSATASGGAGIPFSYSWTGDATISNPNTSNPSVAPTVPTVYEVQVEDANECLSDPQTVTIGLYPAVSVVGSADADTLCTNESFLLLNDGGIGGSGSYDITWNDGTNTFDALAAGNSITLYDLGSYDYDLTIEDQECANYDGIYTYSAPTITVTTQGAPDPNFTINTTRECDHVIFDFERTTVDNISNEECLWVIPIDGLDFTSTNCAGASATFRHDEVKVAQFIVSNQFGCTDSTTKFDNTPTLPDPDLYFTYLPEKLTMLGSEATFTPTDATVDNDTQYSWDFGDGGSAVDEVVTHEFPFNDAGVYPVLLTGVNQYNCTDTITRNVTIEGVWTYYMPSAFSPDGNGNNDVLVPKHIGVSIDDYVFRVYDRWGELMFETTDPNQPWDGTYQGLPAESSVYNWIVETVASWDPTKLINKNGRVTLYR